MDGSILAGTQTMAAALKLHAAFETTCSRIGDVSLLQHALLAGAAEREGLALKEARARFGPLGDVDRLAGELEERELAERARSARDRREFALRATRKGVVQVERVDEALACELVARARGLAEESFERLVGRVGALSASVGGPPRPAFLFPGTFLLALEAYRRLVVREAAPLGLSSFQVAALAALDALADEAAALSYLRQLGLADATVEAQLQRLKDRGLVAAEGGIALDGEGIARLDALGERMRQRAEELLAGIGDEAASDVRGVCEFLVYVLL